MLSYSNLTLDQIGIFEKFISSYSRVCELGWHVTASSDPFTFELHAPDSEENRHKYSRELDMLLRVIYTKAYPCLRYQGFDFDDFLAMSFFDNTLNLRTEEPTNEWLHSLCFLDEHFPAMSAFSDFVEESLSSLHSY